MSIITRIADIFRLGSRRSRSQQLLDENQAMQMALDLSGNHVMCFDLQRNSVYDLHGHALFGNHVSIDDCYTYVHPDDLPAFRRFVERLSQGIDREAECRYRWNYNYSGHGEPEWHDMHSFASGEYVDGSELPVNIITTLTDETHMLQEERETRHLSDRYRLIFENSIIGLSFYNPDGRLLDANRVMREICHFDSDEGDEFFSKVNLFDISPFNEVLDRQHMEDYWACSLSIIPERNMHVYLEISLHPIFDEAGQLVYISVSARDVTAEREMFRRVKQSEVELQEVNKAIQLYEDELRYMMENCKLQAWRISLDRDIIEFYSGLSTVVRSFTLKQMQKIFVNQEDDFVKALSDPSKAISHPLTYMGQMYPVVTQSTTELQWVQINCIPEYDDHGQLKGCFGVLRNINDLMKKQEQLQRETERANQSGHIKSVFLANMTHEIRTPLNAIVGFADVLSMLQTTEEKREMIKIIMNNCDMLLRLVNDILVVSSIDSGEVHIQPAKTDFARSFDETCEQLRPRVEEVGLEFIMENPYNTFETIIDDGRIRQVMTNFLINAVKYTHQGHVRMGYRYEDNGLYLYCEDTGQGIPKESQSKVFERFVKLNDYIQGTGLGLSICKAIADGCKGRIGVESEGEGCGSTFWLWIPCEPLKSEPRKPQTNV